MNRAMKLFVTIHFQTRHKIAGTKKTFLDANRAALCTNELVRPYAFCGYGSAARPTELVEDTSCLFARAKWITPISRAKKKFRKEK